MFVLSVHYKNTETAFREKLALQPEDIGRLQKTLQERGLEEAVYVSTCNRCELYGVGKYDTALLALAETAGVDPSRLRSIPLSGLLVAPRKPARSTSPGINSLFPFCFIPLSFILPSFPILSSTPLHHSHLPFHPMSSVYVPSFSQCPFLLPLPPSPFLPTTL